MEHLCKISYFVSHSNNTQQPMRVIYWFSILYSIY